MTRIYLGLGVKRIHPLEISSIFEYARASFVQNEAQSSVGEVLAEV